MLNQFDIAFIIDTTGSMGSFLHSAQREMKETLKHLSTVGGVDMRVGIVEYRDHPPQDNTYVTKVHPFTDNLEVTDAIIQHLYADGGGDIPEAVFDGIVDTCKKLKWREHARRIALLIGDAPPHGHAEKYNGWDKCPCGETMDTVTSLVEESCIRLFSIPLHDDPVLIKAFEELALLTGGGSFTAGGGRAMTEIRKIVSEEFGHLDLDKKVWGAWHESQGEITPEDLSKKLDASLEDIYDSLGRLGTRNLLEVAVPA